MAINIVVAVTDDDWFEMLRRRSPWTFDELDALQRKNGPVTFARVA
jgi:hypothetical protein